MSLPPNTSIYPLHGAFSALDGFIQPDPTRPWYTERAGLLTYNPPPSTQDTPYGYELVIDRNSIGPFVARSLNMIPKTQITGNPEYMSATGILAIVSGGVTRTYYGATELHIPLTPSIENPILYPFAGSIEWDYFEISISNRPCDETTYQMSPLINNYNKPILAGTTYLPAVQIFRNTYLASIFSTDLITAAGSTVLTSESVAPTAFEIHIPENSTLAVAGNNRIELLSGTNVLWAATPYIPAAIGTTERVYSVKLDSPLVASGGISLSIATAFTAGGVEVNAWA